MIVTTGLLSLVGSDAELAAIVGHEIGHVMARHAGEQQSRTLVAAVGGSMLDAVLQSAIGFPVGAGYLLTKAYSAGAQVGVLLPYARTRESEADRLGLIYMAPAGYDPNATLSVWRKLVAYSKGRKGDIIPSILRTRPVDEQRIVNIQRHLPEVARREKVRDLETTTPHR